MLNDFSAFYTIRKHILVKFYLINMAGIINVVPLPPNFDPKDRFCGTTINNRFHLTRVLGKGNFGVAYCATDKETQKKVAVKKIKTEGDVDHVKNEAVLLTNLNHGGDLETKINEVSGANCKFKPNAILRWTYQMLDALQYMHSRKVLHRDLKPANILLVNNDVKLADFGVSKQLLASTYQGQGAGTILYMSPEMLKGEKYNAKSDIWSLGCVFYELFTLTPIYQALNRQINSRF
uniref:non-specific serine/threonine protein kinase n=1 Tax=Ciona savignyi TaxID=51511 RepID=H2YED3_CIOSA